MNEAEYNDLDGLSPHLAERALALFAVSLIFRLPKS